MVSGTGPPTDPRATALFKQLIAEMEAVPVVMFKQLPTGQRILAASPEEQLQFTYAVLDSFSVPLYRSEYRDVAYHIPRVAWDVLEQMLERPTPLSDAELCGLAERCGGPNESTPMKEAVRVLAKFCTSLQMSEALRGALERLAVRLQSGRYHGGRELARRVDRLLKSQVDLFRVEPVDAWTVALVDVLAGLDETQRGRWTALLGHCDAMTATAPKRIWSRALDAILEGMERAGVEEILLQLLDAAGRPLRAESRVPSRAGHAALGLDRACFDDRFRDCLRGLIFTAGRLGGAALIHAVGSTAERCFTKVRNVGPRSVKIGNACLHVLGESGSHEAIIELTRLESRARHPSVTQQIVRTLDALARRAGVSREDLMDLAAPTEFEPSQLRKLLAPQRERMERMLLAPRTFALSLWRERYLDHPLLGQLARKLIWSVGAGSDWNQVGWDAGRLVDVAGQNVEPPDSASVRLWHPLESPVAAVAGWRGWLAERGVTQPFKQAHRELYLVTDAERRTATYSNRFAAHILRQPALAALCRERDWEYGLQGYWDAHDGASRELPGGLRAELRVEPAGDPEGDTSESLVLLYVCTGRLSFFRGDSTPIALTDVPARVFSEALRDVDLFVGVCSIGSDPTWQDANPDDARHRAYWESVAFGELSEMARTRRSVLEHLLPQLEIASRCELRERELLVRGELHAYRIHLGSANVQIQPSNRYVCIVEDATAREPVKLSLPFEGDRTLSLILSKAFLLAGDSRIEDPAIAAQLR